VERTRAHLLTDILMISILAVMAGAQGWEDIESHKQAWLEFWPCQRHPLCRYVRRVFERIDPKAFEQCFQRWVGTLVERLGRK